MFNKPTSGLIPVIATAAYLAKGSRLRLLRSYTYVLVYLQMRGLIVFDEPSSLVSVPCIDPCIVRVKKENNDNKFQGRRGGGGERERNLSGEKQLFGPNFQH
jgi:hypothetical protein